VRFQLIAIANKNKRAILRCDRATNKKIDPIVFSLMTIHVNLKEAEQKFSQLFSQVLQGEEIIISVEGQEKARLVPSSLNPKIKSDKASSKRIPGRDQGRFVVPDDFDDPLPQELLQAFEGTIEL